MSSSSRRDMAGPTTCCSSTARPWVRSRSRRAGPAVVRRPELDGDPRLGADDRRHRHHRQTRSGGSRTCSRWSSLRTCAGSSCRTTTSLTRQPRAGDGGVPERAAGLQLGDSRSALELLQVPARSVQVGHGRRDARHRRPHRGRRCATRSSIRPRPGGSSTRRRVSTGRRTPSPRRSRARQPASRISTPSSGSSTSRCSHSVP